MKNDVLDYIGLDINNIPKSILQGRALHFSGYTNPKTYKVYDFISIKDLEVLITPLDRTAELKDRYKMSRPLSEYIKADDKKTKELFLDILESASISEIKKLEELEDKMNTKLPYLVRYDKNYLWQIYYSEEDKKYFMLFPANGGETSVLFYIIKKKLEKKDTKIFVPISKKDYSGNILTSSEISDIENYIWLFTNEWPNIYEVCKNKLYITGKTKINGIFESSYRNIYTSKEDAENFYKLLKAIFILVTETNYKYTFNPYINSLGELELKYKEEIINISNLSKFIDNQIELKIRKREELKQEIDKNEKKLKDLKEYVKRQNEIYVMQEKQITMFLQCKKSFFKKLSYFFKSKKFSTPKLENTLEKEEVSSNIELDMDGSYTIKELVNISIEVNDIENKARELKADIRALKIKKENLERKIKNASSYIAEIEKHKKSIFDFWKFTNKDELPALDIGESEENKKRLQGAFNLEQDLEIFGVKADSLQRQKLSTEECDAIYIAKDCLEAINFIDDDKIISDKLAELKNKINTKNNSIDNLLEDYEKVKNLNNREHRENSRNELNILKINNETKKEEFRETLKRNKKILEEAYNKITLINDITVYTGKNEEKSEYMIGDINPKQIMCENSKDIEIYEFKLNEGDNILYYSNNIYFHNINKTLPLGMNVSTKVLFKNPKTKNKNIEEINLLVKIDDFDYYIKKIKIIKFRPK